MNVAQLLDKLLIMADVEAVVAFLPKMLCVSDEPARDPLLQRLDGMCDRFALRLADQQMNVFGHDHIAEYAQPETAPDALQRRLKGVRLGAAQRRTAVIAAKRNEMALSRLVEAPQSPGHGTL